LSIITLPGRNFAIHATEAEDRVFSIEILHHRAGNSDLKRLTAAQNAQPPGQSAVAYHMMPAPVICLSLSFRPIQAD
jgi:hypothetical protein